MSFGNRIFVVLLIFVGSTIVTSCSPKQAQIPEETPAGIITKDSLVMIMTDCFIAEAAAKQVQVQHKNVLKHANAFYNIIFEKYGTTYQGYKNSLEYYHQYPDVAEDIYNLVIENLSKIESGIEIKK